MAIPNQYQSLAQEIYGRPLEDWEYQNLTGKDFGEVRNILQQSMADYQAAQQQTVPGPGPAPTTQATAPAAQQTLNLYEPGYEKRFGTTPPGSFVVGGGDGKLTPEERKAMYERDVRQTALSGANFLQDLVNYKPTGASAYGDLYTRAQSDPSLLRKFHNESDEDALLRLKSNIMDAEQRQSRRQALRSEMGSGNDFVVSSQPYGNLEPANYGGVGLMSALENMRRIQAQNPQFQGIGSIVSALTGAKEPLALGQQIAPKAPVGEFRTEQQIAPKAPVGEFRTEQQIAPKAPVGESRTEQQKAPTGTLQERATTFSDTFKSLTSDPTKTEYDVKKYLDTIRQDKDLMKAYGNKLDPYFAYYDKVPDFTGDTTDYLSKQLQNQQNAGTAEYWKTGKKLSTDTATKYMADTLRKYGINDINQLGIKEVDVPEHTEMQGDSEAGYAEVLVPASKKKVFYNKATGEEITGSGYAKDFDPETGQFGRTTEGKGYTAFRVQFDKDTGKPIFYTTPHSSSDLGSIAPLLAMASFIPGVAPFAQGLNALIAAKQGNVAGALLSGLGAAGGIGQLAGASPQVLSNISTARNIAGVANAIQNKDILGLVSSGAQLGGVDLGATKIAGDITAKDAMFGVAAAKALDNKDYASLLNIAGQMSKNENLQTAAKGIMMVDALKSKNPAKLIRLVGSMAAEDSGLRKPRPAAASGGLLRGPGFVTVPDNAAVDPRVFSGIATPLMARSM